MMKRSLLAVLMLLVFCPQPMLLAQEAALSESTLSRQSELSPAEQEEVNQFFRMVAERLTAENATPGVLLTARSTVRETFEEAEGAGFRRFYAVAAVETLAPAVLDNASPLAQLNGAIAVASIRHPGILPGLDMMSKHENPAVRYWAYRGLLANRNDMLVGRTEVRNGFLEIVRRQCQAESSGRALEALFEVLDPSTLTDAAPGTSRVLRDLCMEQIAPCVRRNLQTVRDGGEFMAGAFSRASRIYEAIGADASQAEKAEMLSVLAEILANTEAAYNDIVSPKDDQDEDVEPPYQFVMLLVDSERAMVTMTGRDTNPVASALVGSMGQTATQVRAAVFLEWVGTKDAPAFLQRAPWSVPVPEVLPRTESEDA